MLNEFRQHPISGDWVLYSTLRAQKPSDREAKFYQPPEECPFEPAKINLQETPVLIYGHGKQLASLSDDWTTLVLPNKFPALQRGLCGPIELRDAFSVAPGAGFHELVITREHDKSFAQFTVEQTSEVLMAYRERFRSIAADSCGQYISIFHNHGHLAGASVFHNHSQILSLPMVPVHVTRLIAGADEYLGKTGKPGYAELLDWELKEKKRIIFENDEFLALCPYVSVAAYEVNIFPKTPEAYFGNLSDNQIPKLAEALNTVMAKLHSALNNPDYDFVINTAPPANKESKSYHWHIQIMPRLSLPAGFEFGTGVFINGVDPDDAALRLNAAVI